MHASIDNVSLHCSGSAQGPATYDEFKLAAIRFLTKLGSLNSDLHLWMARKYDRLVGLSENLSNFDTLFSLADRNALSEKGFTIDLYTFSSNKDGGYLSRENGGSRLRLRGCGMAVSGSEMLLELPLNAYCGLHTTAFLEKVIEIFDESWICTRAEVRPAKFSQCIAEAGDRFAGLWLFYLPMPQLSSCIPGNIRRKEFLSGVLLQLDSAGVPQCENPEDIDCGKRMRKALDSLGLVWHSQYAIHGWPPDEEEWRYEEFISGAPRGRKYRVHCIDFDGYDSQRNVLLYAKLFRRLRHQRKEWGLRGWDGPVLNEAKRQVRAANGTQIEWHIGLEEPAARVRTLLADYTDFTESQLNVIYTPLSQALAGR
jgi:hypothetical protein